MCPQTMCTHLLLFTQHRCSSCSTFQAFATCWSRCLPPAAEGQSWQHLQVCWRHLPNGDRRHHQATPVGSGRSGDCGQRRNGAAANTQDTLMAGTRQRGMRLTAVIVVWQHLIASFGVGHLLIKPMPWLRHPPLASAADRLATPHQLVQSCIRTCRKFTRCILSRSAQLHGQDCRRVQVLASHAS